MLIIAKYDKRVAINKKKAQKGMDIIEIYNKRTLITSVLRKAWCL